MELTAEYRERLREEVLTKATGFGVSAPGEAQDDVIPFVSDLNNARRLEKLAELLIAPGHSSRRVDKILGANFLRPMREVWTTN